MEVQMKQAMRPAPARATSRAAGGTAARAAAPESTALGPAAQRMNAGPHAASLSALQAVVAQRACADCEHVRRAMGGAEPVQRAAKNPGGLPDGLRAGLESLSGRDLSGVTVSYDSPRPAQLNAHAYAQGSTIHVAPGQERHLPHEGWHAVQQMQNRVRPTMDVGGTPVNDSAQLEREADVMGARALSVGGAVQRAAADGAPPPRSGGAVVQRAIVVNGNAWYTDPRDVEYMARRQGANKLEAAMLAKYAGDGLTHHFPSWVSAIDSIRERVPIENTTRMGFEIETGTWLKVSRRMLPQASALVNETLAYTELLEFVIDDVKEKESAVQVEFRTRPLTRKQMANAPKIKADTDRSIGKFPLNAFQFGGDLQTLQNALVESGWTPTDALNNLAGGLTPLTFGRLKAKLPQHVTHSVPLAAFVNLSPADKELLIPGSGKVKSVAGLLSFFYKKKLLPQVAGSQLVVSTTGRNDYAPNMKTAIDTVAGLLKPESRDRLMPHLAHGPESVRVEGGDEAPMGPLESEEVLPAFPHSNPQQGRGYLAAEEKLKPPLFDYARGDVRVLIEHRVNQKIVKAVQLAMSGKPGELQPYLNVFAKLDQTQVGDEFAHWFQG